MAKSKRRIRPPVCPRTKPKSITLHPAMGVLGQIRTNVVMVAALAVSGCFFRPRDSHASVEQTDWSSRAVRVPGEFEERDDPACRLGVGAPSYTRDLRLPLLPGDPGGSFDALADRVSPQIADMQRVRTITVSEATARL